jgi:dUTP pyrophosphatase
MVMKSKTQEFLKKMGLGARMPGEINEFGIPSILIERIRPDAYMPEKAHSSDSGYDIRIPDGLHFYVNELKLIKTGIRMALPHGWECQVRSRSSLPLKHGLMFALGVGTIDSGYRGEIKVPLLNISDKPVQIKRGTAIVQLVFQKLDDVYLRESPVSTDTERGEGGFGSTDD